MKKCFSAAYAGYLQIINLAEARLRAIGDKIMRENGFQFVG